MSQRSVTISRLQAAWLLFRSFNLVWLELVSLGGFVVLLLGKPLLNGLAGAFGPAAARPAGVIFLLMFVTLPFACYLWIQRQRQLGVISQCAECGEVYPATQSSCPACGGARVKKGPADKTAPVSAKS